MYVQCQRKSQRVVDLQGLVAETNTEIQYLKDVIAGKRPARETQQVQLPTQSLLIAWGWSKAHV